MVTIWAVTVVTASSGLNDRLAARVAQIVEADLLLLLTDVKGLYNKNPKHNDDVKLVDMVKKIDSQIYKMASSQTNSYGSGGMFTKIQAAEIAGSYGCNTLIFQGNIVNPFKNLKKNNVGSLFISSEKKKKGVKNWLAGSINISGTLEIDKGAINALNKGAMPSDGDLYCNVTENIEGFKKHLILSGVFAIVIGVCCRLKAPK